MNNKKIAIDEFKHRTISVLRQNGFTGSFPHFRRIRESQIDLLSIQFDKYGGGYRICLSKCPTQNIKDILNKNVEPRKTTAWHFGDRYVSDWLRYDDASEDKIQTVAEKLSLESIAFLNIAEQYWEGKVVQRQSKYTIWRYKILSFLNRRIW